ncbi:hypothetical protein U1Q18_052252 [Sarracenia purpurea var. burkii]
MRSQNLPLTPRSRPALDSIEHGYEISDASLTRMAKAQIYLVPTDYLADSPLFSSFSASPSFKIQFEERSQRRLHKAMELGVPVAFGSDEYYDIAGLSRGTGESPAH